MGDEKTPIERENAAFDRPVTGGKAKKNALVSVTFIKRWKKGYCQNDRAGFPAAVAKKLVDAGVARYTKGPVKRVIDAVVEAVTGGDVEPHANAKDTIALIAEVETVEKLEAYIDGEERKGVLGAIEKRMAELNEQAGDE